MSLFFEIKEGCATIDIKVQPNSGKNEIVGLHGEVLKVRLKSPPVDGAANEELILFFSKEFKVPKSGIEITSGHASKNKRLKMALSDRLSQFLFELEKEK